MDAPKNFRDRLEQAFQGRLRIRYSDRERAWHIEQQVGRAVVAPIAIEADRDDLIRARDGYHFVMSIREGTRMPCPVCHYELEVPAFDTADIRCGYCALKGRQTRVVAGFFPLNDFLIDHLRKIDPLRGAQRELAEQADRANALRLKAAEADLSDTVISAASDDYRRLVGIPMTGYTGKELR